MINTLQQLKQTEEQSIKIKSDLGEFYNKLIAVTRSGFYHWLDEQPEDKYNHDVIDYNPWSVNSGEEYNYSYNTTSGVKVNYSYADIYEGYDTSSDVYYDDYFIGMYLTQPQEVLFQYMYNECLKRFTDKQVDNTKYWIDRLEESGYSVSKVEEG